MKDIVLELFVGLALAALGVAVLYPFVGSRAWNVDPELAYLVGAVVFSVPAIVVMERRRRRRPW